VTADQLIAAAREVLGEFTLSNEYFRAGNVAAALFSKAGNVYTGICIDVACGIGFCAEHAAIAELLKHRETEIEMIVAVSDGKVLPPCGRCRELMYQIDHRNADTNIVLSSTEIVTLNELLPRRFL
jgi:cytidine deaminase